MQTFIDFLVNNYTWFIIIALILIFALIGYLVDTSEKPEKTDNLENDIQTDSISNTQIKQADMGVLNMDTGLEENGELAKDVIVMPKKIETPTIAPEQILNPSTPTEEKTEVLDV